MSGRSLSNRNEVACSLRRLKALHEAEEAVGAGEGVNSAGEEGLFGGGECDAGGSSEEDETLEVVRGMQTLQKIRRRRRRGVDAASACEVKEEEEEEEETDAFAALDKSFASGGKTGAGDRHLEEFLRKHLKADEHERKEREALRMHEQQDELKELYAVPEHLQVKDKTEEYKDQMNWVTGLVEVELPMELKLKNIEATEKAKRQLLRKGLLGDSKEEDPEDAESVRKQAFGQRFTWFVPDAQFKKRLQGVKSSDSKAVEQFAKRTRRMNDTRGRVGVVPM